MRVVQLLFLIFAMSVLPVFAQAQSVSANMLVSAHVIQACSVSAGDDILSDDDMNNNIHCGANAVHRIAHHREHASHQGHASSMKRDQDDIRLTTVEF